MPVGVLRIDMLMLSHVTLVIPSFVVVGVAVFAIAMREWKVEPILSQSLVWRGGVWGERGVWKIRPPEREVIRRER